jgi:hypothetical protein
MKHLKLFEEFINEIKLNDLINKKYTYVIGNSEEKSIGANDKEYVLNTIEASLRNLLYDFDFALNYLDSSQRKAYTEFFEREFLNPRLKNIDKTLNLFFTISGDKVKWKLSSAQIRQMIDDMFSKNTKMPSDIKKEYYDYRLEYAGVKLNEGEVTNDSGLKKVYLATRRDSKQKWWSYKGFAGNKFFIQVTENNIDKLEINPDYPILNYQSEIIEQLLKEGRIKEENIYNHPKWIPLSGSKEEFHKLVGNDENVPKTVYTKNEALKKLTFPIIAKPANGHSGVGIQIIKTPSLMEDIDEKMFDTYSEYVDKAEEMRFFNFKGNPIFWMERTPANDKAKNGKGEADEEMEFKYARRDVKNIPNEYKTVLEKYCKIFAKFEYICFDMMKDKAGKVYVIESNSQPGVPFDSTVEIYKHIYEDFYKKPLDEYSVGKLNDYANQMIEKTLAKDKGRFSVKP